MDRSLNLLNQLHLRQITSKLSETRAFRANLYRARFISARNLYKTDLHAHYGCVNAIEFSYGGKYLASGGDDKRILIWDIEKAIAGVERPRVLEAAHTSNIFCLGFDKYNRRVFSGGNDDLVIVHDFETGKLHNVFKHETPVYGLSVDPLSENIFATASDDGQILVFDLRKDTCDPLVVAQLRTSFHAVEFHPIGSNFLVTANSKRGAAFWDIRRPHHPIIQYGNIDNPPSCMSVRFNTTGQQILALRRRLPPILYNTQSPEPVCTFYHEDYYNSCTMKSCTFAGENDELVLSGSDNFNLYAWRVSDVDLERTDQWIEDTQMVLYGHRSIVNQVRYNREKCLLASSGVEKIVKLWSPFEQKGWTGSLLEEAFGSDNPRDLYAAYTLPPLSTSPQPHSWSHMSHDYSSCNTNEDPRMMSFFDTLIQQEIEGWNTNTSGSSSDSGSIKDNTTEHCKRARHSVRKKERHRRKKMLNRSKIHRHNYDNRITYLIATKRYTLRRLALKGATTMNRRPYKITQFGVISSRKRNLCVDVCEANGATSRKKSKEYDSSSDGDEEIDPSDGQNSSIRNDVSFPNNISIPSTSTGITSSQKDDIIRLRQQQICDDSDEDDEDESNENIYESGEVLVDSALQPIKKLNGVRRTNDAAISTNSNSHSRRINQQRNNNLSSHIIVDSVENQNNYHGQNLPSSSSNTRAAFTCRDNTAATGSNNELACSSISEHHNSNHHHHHHYHHSRHSISKIINRRPRLGMTRNVPINETTADNNGSSNNRLTSPTSKRKKLSININEIYNTSSSNDENDTLDPNISGISSCSSSNNNNNNNKCNNYNQHPFNKLTEKYNNEQMQENKNYAVDDIGTTTKSPSSNKNIIRDSINRNYDSSCGSDNDYDSMNISVVKNRSTASGSGDNYNLHNNNNNLLQTPDSGISIATVTPSCSRNSYNNHSDSESCSSNSNQKRSPPASVGSGGGGGSVGGGVGVGNTNSMNFFYQKVARVRRNYRKKFADGSESD